MAHQSDTPLGHPPTPFPSLTLSGPPSSILSSAHTPGSMALEGSSPVFLPPAGPETPIRHNLPKLMTTKLFYLPEQPVRRNLFGSHFHGCPYNDAHLLGMADHPTPPLSKRRSRLECNCAKLLEEGYDQVEEERDNTVGAREMNGSLPSFGRGKILDGKVCATLSWSSSPTKGGDEEGDEGMVETGGGGMEDEQQYPPTSTLSERSRSAPPPPYSSTWEGRPEDIALCDELHENGENDAVESSLKQESTDISMGRLTLHTADEGSKGQRDPDPEDDCDTICDTEYDTEMEVEPHADYNYQNQVDTEGGEDGGYFTFEGGQQSDFDNRAALAALTGGPRKALWYPAESLAQGDHILGQD